MPELSRVFGVSEWEQGPGRVSGQVAHFSGQPPPIVQDNSPTHQDLYKNLFFVKVPLKENTSKTQKFNFKIFTPQNASYHISKYFAQSF